MKSNRCADIVLCGLMFLSVVLKGQDIDPMTGRAIINIPLGQISAVDMSVSLGLSHHGGALRVNEAPGNAGMGWTLSTGSGYVGREVRGLPDEYNSGGRKGWLINNNATTIQNFTPTADDNLGVCSDEVTDWNFINNLGYLNDTEPDLYYFEAPGISGRFVYGTDGLPKLIPYQDLQVSFSGSIFTIKTNTGLIYTFGAVESVTRQSLQFKVTPIDYFKPKYNYYSTPVSYVTTWKLSSIESKSTGTIINFSYGADEAEVNTQYFTTLKGNTQQVDTLFYLRDQYTPLKLTSITLKSYSIAFTWGNGVIIKVSISESESGDIREYEFVYKDIKSTQGGMRRKPFLIKVKQLKSCLSFPDYVFTYNSVDTVALTIPMNWKTGWGQDYFGYHNGRNANKNIPTVYYYANESGGRRLRVTPIPLLTETQKLNGVTGENMDVNATYSKVGTLARIYYPTGGITTFNYESNKYLDGTTGQELAGPGVRVSSIITAGGDAAYGKAPDLTAAWHELKKTYEYFAPDNVTTSGRLLYPPSFGFTDGVNFYRSQEDLGYGSEVLYGRVKEKIPGMGYRIYQYDLEKSYPDATSDATISKIARPSGTCTLLSLAKNGSYTWPFAPVSDNSFKRGFLTRVSEYTEGDKLTNDKRMVYTMPQTSSSIKGLRFEEIIDATGKRIFYYSTYIIPINQSRIISQEFTKTIGDESPADSSKTNIAYTYNTKNMVTKTTQTNDDNSVLESFIKYAMDFNITSPVSGDTLANAIFKLNNPTVNRYGQVVENYKRITPIGGTATYVEALLTVFRDYGSNVWPYQQKHLPPGAAFTPAAINGTTTQGVTTDTDYLVDSKLEFASGLPVSQIGTAKIRTSSLYSTNSTVPIASLVNCRSENVIYEGFEMATGRGLTSTGAGPSSAVEARTGQKSLTLTTSFVLNSASITKSENSYRISVWAFATSGNINVTVKAKNGSTVQQTLILNYPTSSANKWGYLEGVMNTTGVSSAFTIEISSSAAIRLDDFVAVPKSATITFGTALPLTGPTSATDDRGNSNVIVYDPMGRQVNLLDNNRNLVKLTEYGLQKQGRLILSANFSSNTAVYVKGQPVTFTATSQSCFSGVSYQWTFTDLTGNTTNATGNQVSKTFTNFGVHNVSLTVSKAGYATQTYTQTICVDPSVLSASMTVSPDMEWKQCDITPRRIKTFTALHNWAHPGMNMDITYTWYATNSSGVWVQLLSGGSIISMSGNQLVYESPFYDYQVKCDISIRPSVDPDNISCEYAGGQVTVTTTGPIHYTNDQPCQ